MTSIIQEWAPIAAPIIIAIIGSTGLWGYLEKKRHREDSRAKLLKGMSQVLIALKVNEYTNRGYVTPDEFATLHNLIYTHYKDIGGNGNADRLMKRLESLPVKKPQEPSRRKNESPFWRYPK